MYPSKLFQETDRDTLIARIKTYPFGLVVTVDSDGIPKTAHVPVLLENRSDGTFILFHLTRNNAVCQPLLDGQQCLCVFTGPNAYISPDWYDVPSQVENKDSKPHTQNTLRAPRSGIGAGRERCVLRDRRLAGDFEFISLTLMGCAQTLREGAPQGAAASRPCLALRARYHVLPSAELEGTKKHWLLV